MEPSSRVCLGGMECRLGCDKYGSEVIGFQNIVHRHLEVPERFFFFRGGGESARFILRKILRSYLLFYCIDIFTHGTRAMVGKTMCHSKNQNVAPNHAHSHVGFFSAKLKKKKSSKQANKKLRQTFYVR